jgi:hypothetical protein
VVTLEVPGAVHGKVAGEGHSQVVAQRKELAPWKEGGREGGGGGGPKKC